MREEEGELVEKVEKEEEEASDNPLSLSFQQWETKEKEVGEGGKVLDFEGRSEERKE